VRCDNINRQICVCPRPVLTQITFRKVLGITCTNFG